MTEVVRARLRSPRADARSIARPRALAAFAEAAGVPLVCVEAEAGYGKTTFVDAVTAGTRRAWYALTAADRDPHTFLAHLAAAVGSAPQPVVFQPRGTWSALLDLAVDRLDDWSAAGGTHVVLDDYHLVQGSPVDGVVGRLLELLPPTVQIVATSRTRLDPGSWGSRSTGYDAFRTISRGLLSFDEEETRAFLRSRFGITLQPSVIELLVEETEGWPIALSLIGRRLHRGDHQAEELLAALPAGRESVFDFLGSRVFADQPGEVQRFLLDVSVLSPLTAESCAAVAGTTVPAAQRMLRAVGGGGLFCAETVAGSYRMHQLFSRFLQTQIDPARRRELHAAAAQHHRDLGEHDRAASHALAACQHEAAAHDVVAIADQLMASGRHLTLLDLTDDLGSSLDDHPTLLVARSHALRLSSRFAEATDLAQRAGRLAGGEAADTVCGALRAELAVYLDTVNPAQGEPVLARLEALSRDERGFLAERIENDINIGRLAAAERLLDGEGAAHAGVLRPRLLVRQGRLIEARGLLERYTGRPSRIPMAHREASVLLAWIHSVLGHADRAAQHARVGIDLGGDLCSPLLTCVSTGRLGLALISGTGHTNPREAQQHLLASLEMAERLGADRFRAEPLMGLTVLADRLGRPEDTRRFGLDAVQTLAAAGDRYLEAAARLALGAALAGQSDPTARPWLQDAADQAIECGDALVPLLADQWRASLDLGDGDRAAFAVRAADVLARAEELNLTDIWLTPGWLGITDPAVRGAWLDAAWAEDETGVLAGHLRNRMDQSGDGAVHASSTTGPGLRITTLDGFSVQRGDTALTAESWSRRKAVDILLLLCASERHSQSRAEVVDKLWPDLTREQATVRFRVTLHALHQVLEPHRRPRDATCYVRTSADRIWLDPDHVSIDADDFRTHADRLLGSAAIDPQAAQQALAAYRQPFLHDHPTFEWATPTRDQLAARFRDLTLATADALLDAGNHTAAIAACQRLLTHDPFVEPAHQLMAEGLLASGDAASAHRAYRDCVRLLAEELGIKPAWTLKALGRPRTSA